MSQNKTPLLVAVAVLSAAATALYYQLQNNTSQGQVTALRSQVDALKLQKDPIMAQRNQEIFEQAQLDKNLAESDDFIDHMAHVYQDGMKPVPKEVWLGSGSFRKRTVVQAFEIRVPTEVFKKNKIRFGFDNLIFIGNTQYELPASRNRRAECVNGDVTVNLDVHTLQIRRSELIWDRVDFGPAPAQGQVRIKDDGGVIVNGVPRRALSTSRNSPSPMPAFAQPSRS